MRLMRAYGWVFLATGIVFVAAAVPLTALLGLPNGGMGLWLGLAGSLMAVISLLSFQIAEDPFLDSRWNLLLLSKAVSSLLFAAFAVLGHNAAFLIGTAVDSAIFLHLAFLRSGVSFPHRGRAGAGPFSEAWFVMVCDPASRRGFWARYALSRGRAQCRAVLFDKAAGRVAAESWERPLSELESGSATAYRLGDLRLARGCAAGPSWNLSWPEAEVGALGFAPPLLTGAGLLSAGYEAAEGLVRVTGEVRVDGLTARFTNAAGGVGHLWSPRGARGWRWARAVFERPGGTTVFEILTADAPLPGRLSAPLTAARLVHEGRSLSSVGALASLRARSELRGGTWSFRVRFGGVVAEGECRLDSGLIAEFPYDAPAGRGVCRTSMTGSLRLSVREGGFPLAELETPEGAIVEFAEPSA
ncbi:MAG: hypothetical protein PHS14_14790 [Elusimicrobia bacterium]|nr:hypothetical protein [Elusimicrobiota bacterium]